MKYTIEDIRNRISSQRAILSEDFCVKNLFLFGSYAKGLQNENSDIDFLVEFSDDVDMFKMVDLQEFLTELFNKKIDLGTPNGLKSFIKDNVLKEAVLI